MSEIDWSKMPEGATGWLENQFIQPGAWIRPGEFWSDKRHKWLKLEAKPWNGQGLPPVGTVCEYTGRCYGMAEPHEVEVIHHYHGGAAMVAAFLYTRNGQTRVASAIAGSFRPIRMPEQIAAEERNKAIEGIMDQVISMGSPSVSMDTLHRIAAGLYDAGYRKAEGGVQ